MKHALFSHKLDIYIDWFDKFDKEKIKSSIVKHLEEDPKDTIEHCKEYSKKNVNKYYGMQIVNFYCMNNSKPCLIVTKGGKEYYKPLTKQPLTKQP